jgi:hypothetical protein
VPALYRDRAHRWQSTLTFVSRTCPIHARRFSTAALPLVFVALAALPACGSSPNGPSDAGANRADAASDAGADLGDVGSGGDAVDGDDGPPIFDLGLRPPAVDCAPYPDASACVLHVAPGSPAAGADGLSWATALSDPQAAIDRATCGCEVWIAAGTYLPTRSLDAPDATPDPRDLAFVLWPGVHVMGGFAGGETTPDARTPGHETILSADLGVVGSTADNAYHVVVGADGAELDGLTLAGGEANGFLLGQSVGAGLLSFSAAMTLRDVTFRDNDADSGAGLFADERSSPHVVGCTFARNTANDGGGMVVLGPTAVVERSLFEDNAGVFSGPAITQFAKTLTVTDSRFLRNRGDSGGALTVSGGDATFERCWFEGNQAGSFGGVMLVRFGGSAHVSSSVLVANGSVGFGGALAVWTSSLAIEASTIVDNTAALGGAFLVKDGSTFGLRDSVVWRSVDDQGAAFDLDGAPSTTTVTTSDVPSEVPAAASFVADPQLANVPLTTRFAEESGGVDHLPIAGAGKVFKAGDRVELGDDGVERKVTAVTGDDVSFAPPLAAAAPRFLRVDLWAADAPSLDLDLTPQPGSPLIDAASASAPPLDVFGHARVRAPDIGAIEAP